MTDDRHHRLAQALRTNLRRRKAAAAPSAQEPPMTLAPPRKLDIASLSEQGGSGYPAPYDAPVRSRRWKALGDAAGLTQFGVNLVTVPPGGWSSQRHWHAVDDEFVWMVSGELVLVTDAGEQVMRPGDCAGFKGGDPDGHHLQNRTDADASFLVVGGRGEGDFCTYPEADMKWDFDREGFVHRDGAPY